MNNYNEHPFEYLRRKNVQRESVQFDDDIVTNWYKARAFVLDKLYSITIQPEEDAHLHIVILEDDELMLSIARQVALYAHFPNYDEDHPNESKRNRTTITLVSSKENIMNLLMQEEHLCNLPKYCKTTMYGNITNKDSYIDIELEIVKHWTEGDNEYMEAMNGTHTEKRLVFRKQDVESFCKTKTDEEIYSIDTRKAQYAHRMYCLGREIDNLPYDDIHNVKRYEMAMNVFQHIKMKEAISKMVKDKDWEKEENQLEVLTALSNVFSSDCFLIRYNSIKPYWVSGKTLEKQVWGKYCNALSKSEHARWVVEKLILGYRPLNLRERLIDESLIIDKERKKQFRKYLKSNWKSPVHIDLCSYSNLRRTDPGSLKYDSFLMLGIPDILRKVGEINTDKKNK